ncbi:gfo/Idh/MocA family oxidoreductase, partial [Streptomyces sp. SID5785]|nr:gfo/Idh/MocA family oxidoreductase [Streptomyces sp. SID5785]
LDAVRTAPEPRPLPADAWHTVPGTAPGTVRRVVPGIDALVAAGAEARSGFAALGAPWARPASEVAP